MDFEFTDDQLDLQRTVRDLLEAECPPELVRGVTAGEADGAELWRTQVSLDWPALALPEQYGGIGYTWVELAIVLEELGRVVAPGPFVATITQLAPAIAELGSEEQRSRWLEPVAAGQLTGTLALDEGSGDWALSSVAATARRQDDDLVLAGTKRFVIDGATADEVAVVVRLDQELRVVIVPGADLVADTLASIDATTPVATLELDGVTVSSDRLLGDGDATEGLERAIEEATAAVAIGTVGVCDRILAMVLEYVKERRQFGVPIGSFQAVKHKLADMYRDVERARALGHFAALCLAEDDPRRSVAVAMAKAGAGEAQQRCFQDGLQLFGGIGYTWEHDLHLFLRRAKVGELVFGGAARHRGDVARRYLAGQLG